MARELEKPANDAEAADRLIQTVSSEVLPDELPTEPDNPAPIVPSPGAHKLDARTAKVASGWEPFQLIPGNSERVSLQIYGTSNTPTDYILFSNDSGDFGNEDYAARLYNGQSIEIDSYTGTIWVAPSASMTGPFTVTAIGASR